MPLISKWPWFAWHKHEGWASLFVNLHHHWLIQTRDVSRWKFISVFKVNASIICLISHKGIPLFWKWLVGDGKCLYNFLEACPVSEGVCHWRGMEAYQKDQIFRCSKSHGSENLEWFTSWTTDRLNTNKYPWVSILPPSTIILFVWVMTTSLIRMSWGRRIKKYVGKYG